MNLLNKCFKTFPKCFEHLFKFIGGIKNKFSFLQTYHFHLKTIKEELFNEAFSKIIDKNKRLEILEIGIGTGQNFRYFPENSNVTILDKTDKYLEKLKDSIIKNKRQDLRISDLVLNDAENMNLIESSSMDAVVHTFILCSVKDIDKVLSEIQRVLKPGGVCIFIEHSLDNGSRFRKLIQKTVQIFSRDCKFKEMKKLIEKGSKYDVLTLRQHNSSSIFLFFINPIVYGYGQKL